MLFKIIVDEKKCKSDIEITNSCVADRMVKMSLYREKCNFVDFSIQSVEKKIGSGMVLGRIDGKNMEMIFCIIFQLKICVKIIPKLEKSTTQVKNMCYNIVG